MFVHRGNESEIYAYMECDDTECVWREADTNSDKSFICSYNQGLCHHVNNVEDKRHMHCHLLAPSQLVYVETGG